MKDEHLEHTQDVELRPVGVFGQGNDQQAQMPRVFGVILGPPAVDEHGLPEDLLQLVDFNNEADLPGEAFGDGVHGPP